MTSLSESSHKYILYVYAYRERLFWYYSPLNWDFVCSGNRYVHATTIYTVTPRYEAIVEVHKMSLRGGKGVAQSQDTIDKITFELENFRTNECSYYIIFRVKSGVSLYRLDAVAQSVECRLPVWMFGSSNPGWIKPMTYKIDTCLNLAWCSVLLG